MIAVQRSNTILYTDRWVETVEFYRDRLSLAVTFENDWFVEFALGAGAFVSVADAARSSVAPGRGDGITLSLQVDHLGRTRDELARAGVEVGDLGVRWGADVFDVHDPAGNRVEFWAAQATETR